MVIFTTALTHEYWETSAGVTLPSGGSASSYPWTITVSGFVAADTLSGIEITIYNFTHPSIGDLTIAISGPSALPLTPPFRVLIGDVLYQPISGLGVTLVFNSSAPRFGQNPSATLVSGTYAPTNFFCPDGWENSFPAAPPIMSAVTTPLCPGDGTPPFPTDGTAGVIEDFWTETLLKGNGNDYNGDWNMWIYDNVNFPSAIGSISKWSIDFKYVNITPPSPTPSITPTSSVTASRTMTPSYSASPSQSNTPAASISSSASPSSSVSATVSASTSSSTTPTPTGTPTRTRSNTASKSAARTPTPTRTITPTPTLSPPQCGDGITQSGEFCDDGKNPPASSCCSKSCTFLSFGTVCGDPMESQCWSPRVCDGAGTCKNSAPEPEGTTCFDTYRHAVGNCTINPQDFSTTICRTYKA